MELSAIEVDKWLYVARSLLAGENRRPHLYSVQVFRAARRGSKSTRIAGLGYTAIFA